MVAAWHVWSELHRDCFTGAAFLASAAHGLPAMPPTVKANACLGFHSGCFYARKMYNWAEYACSQCGVRTEDLIASNSYNMHCIVCYYAHPENQPCRQNGCVQAMQIVRDLQARLALQAQQTTVDAEMRDSNDTIDRSSNAASSSAAHMLAISSNAMSRFRIAQVGDRYQQICRRSL